VAVGGGSSADAALTTDTSLLIIHGYPNAVDKAKNIIADIPRDFYTSHGTGVAAGYGSH
jgi:hypothetical protein